MLQRIAGIVVVGILFVGIMAFLPILWLFGQAQREMDDRVKQGEGEW